MCRIVLTTVFLLCLIISVNAQPQWFWARGITGSGSTMISRVTVNNQNHIVAGGFFNGTVSIGDSTYSSVGSNDAFLVWLDNGGNVLNSLAFGGVGDEQFTGICTDNNDNVWITGPFSQSFTLGSYVLNNNGNYDIYAAKISPSGEVLNAIAMGSSSTDYGAGIAVSGMGYVYLTGSYSYSLTIGTTTLTCSYVNSFVARFDDQFNPVWAIQPNDYGETTSISRIGTNAQDECFILGTYNYHCSFNTDNPIHLYSTHTDTFAAKIGLMGNCLWATKIGNGATALTGGFVNHNGNAYVICEMVAFPTEIKEIYRPDLTPRVAKCSDYGDWLWWHEYNSMPYCMYNRVTATPEDWCYMTGQLVGAQTFGNDNLSGNSLQRTLFVARADQNGEWQWGLPAIAGSFPSSAFPMDIIPIDTDNFIVVGRYSSSGVTFGNIVIPPANQTSAFIAKGGTEIVSNTDLISTRPGIKLKVFPNPFSDKLRLDFTLNKAKALSAGIYNIKGQCLKHFESAVYSKGKHSIYWDGKTSDGMQTASGVYLIKLQDENRAYSRIIVKK